MIQAVMLIVGVIYGFMALILLTDVRDAIRDVITAITDIYDQQAIIIQDTRKDNV